MGMRITKFLFSFLTFTVRKVVRKLELCQLSQQMLIDFLPHRKHLTPNRIKLSLIDTYIFEKTFKRTR